MNHPSVVRMMRGYDTSGLPLSFRMVYESIRYRSVAMRRFGVCVVESQEAMSL